MYGWIPRNYAPPLMRVVVGDAATHMSIWLGYFNCTEEGPEQSIRGRGMHPVRVYVNAALREGNMEHVGSVCCRKCCLVGPDAVDGCAGL